MTKHVFIIGSKGIPAKYGGFETFVDQLTARKTNQDIRYHIACMSDKDGEFEYHDARCFQIKVPRAGSAKAVIYDLLSLKACLRYIRHNQLYNSVVYVLACRIGPFFYAYKRALEKLGVQVWVNPDGHEWKRGKWNKAVKMYWKISERLMVKRADLLICDSRGIEQYIHRDYAKYHPRTSYIAYGADLEKSTLTDRSVQLKNWMDCHGIHAGEYYLIVGRFVPENNYELIIKEFMKAGTEKSLVIVTGTDNNPYYEELAAKTGFKKDERIKFVGTVYDQQLLKKIRELAFAYLHGHEVGGTNPSLLEALASTRLNLLYDVVFNREVGAEGALYFTNEPGSLAAQLEQADEYSEELLQAFEEAAKERIRTHYSWSFIVNRYEKLFTEDRVEAAEEAQVREAVNV
ncbi:beta 1-4 rhamnosyltransferase Cps2T [Paenibacillus chibensis]|uniref:beta 1-4 rhamnosyltransferase Cps2T n=1 Tax=Paenibacillus chibensis TaxID=59846 RepID=UPI000FD6DAE7|nr:DUF1972 domain-containing protein [Paenibacillus chibensis]MEC0369206.1 DUF1972 domain-containing protein [Paenibacillus chibensis]